MTEFSSIYANLYDLFHSNKDYDKESQEILNFVRALKPAQEIESILDMGCGTGMHIEALSKHELECFGYDLSIGMLEVAKKRCPGVKFYSRIDTLFLNVDLAVAMFDVISYILDQEELESFFRGAFQQLRRGGYFYADSWNFEGVLNDPPHDVDRQVYFNKERIIRRVRPQTSEKSRLEFTSDGISTLDIQLINLETNSELPHEIHKIKAWSPEEVRKSLENVGFEAIDLFSLKSKGLPPTRDDFRFGVIARRPANNA